MPRMVIIPEISIKKSAPQLIPRSIGKRRGFASPASAQAERAQIAEALTCQLDRPGEGLFAMLDRN